MKFPHLYYCLFLLLFSSCEREINLEAQNQAPKLVVDASIENNSAPVVVLSTSLNYFGTISPEELSASFVHDAVVTITDGFKSVSLVEYTYRDSSGFDLYYYTVDYTDPQHVLLGQLDRTYNLTIMLS